MAKRLIQAGATDQTIDIFVNDSSSTTGAGLTGLVYNTSSLVCYYRKGATGTPTALTLATQTVGGAHSDGGFVAVDGTNCPGQYRLDLSDTIVATAGMVTLYLKGAANMAPVLVEIEVGNPKVDVDTIKTQAVTCAAGVTVSTFVGSTGAAINGTNANTLSSHDPGATLGTSTLTQTQVTGGAYALNSASFSFNSGLDFTTTQKAATLARVTLTDTATTLTNAPSDSSGVTTLLSRIPSGIFTGITSLAQWLGLIAGKQTGNTTARTEIRATGAGSGTYDETTDSQEALRDRGDAAWTTATSVTVSDKTGFSLANGSFVTATFGTCDFTSTMKASINAEADTALADYDAPTNAEMVARTLAAANYFDPAADSVIVGTNNDKTGYSLTNLTVSAGVTLASGTHNPQTGDAYAAVASAVPDSVPADGSRPSIQQGIYMLVQLLTESGISGTTWTIKKPDGTTTLFTITLNDATTPTSKTRAS